MLQIAPIPFLSSQKQNPLVSLRCCLIVVDCEQTGPREVGYIISNSIPWLPSFDGHKE